MIATERICASCGEECGDGCTVPVGALATVEDVSTWDGATLAPKTVAVCASCCEDLGTVGLVAVPDVFGYVVEARP